MEGPLPTRIRRRAAWRFLVAETPGKRIEFLIPKTPGERTKTYNAAWIKVAIPPGQEKYFFAAQVELRIPGVAPMTYVDDLTSKTAYVWADAGEYGAGYYNEQLSPPRLILDSWGRTSEQVAAATAAAKAQAKAAASARAGARFHSCLAPVSWRSGISA